MEKPLSRRVVEDAVGKGRCVYKTRAREARDPYAQKRPAATEADTSEDSRSAARELSRGTKLRRSTIVAVEIPRKREKKEKGREEQKRREGQRRLEMISSPPPSKEVTGEGDPTRRPARKTQMVF
jgi:hypothetical protein